MIFAIYIYVSDKLCNCYTESLIVVSSLDDSNICLRFSITWASSMIRCLTPLELGPHLMFQKILIMFIRF